MAGAAINRFFTLTFGTSAVATTQIANRFAKHWGVTIPKEVGEVVVCRQSDEWRGSMVMTKLGVNQYQITHNNDPKNPEVARKDIPYMNTVQEISPPGWGGTTSAMFKKHKKEIDNPWALCFTANTKVRLADSRILTMLQLCEEHEKGITNYVFSYDKNECCLSIAKIEDAFLSGYQQEVLEVELDNGEKIQATQDHTWLTADDKEIATKNITPGLSLKPIYFEYKNTSFLDGYERVFSNNTKKYLSHWLSAQYKYGYCKKKNHVIHHYDFNKLNNSPDNLVFETTSEHSILHRKFANKGLEKAKEYWNSDQGKQRASIWGKRQAIKLAVWRKENDKEYRRICSAQGKLNGSTTGAAALRKYNTSEACRNKARNNTHIFQKIKLQKICKWLIDHKLSVNETNWETARKNFYQGSKFDKIYKWYNTIDELILDTEKRYNLTINHKVISIKKCKEKQNVYDITVEKYHNFALAAGVFVHNSWHMKNKGAHPHYKNDPEGTKSKKEPVKKEKYKNEDKPKKKKTKFKEWLEQRDPEILQEKCKKKKKGGLKLVMNVEGEPIEIGAND